MKTKFIAAALALSSFAMFGSYAVAQEDLFRKPSEATRQGEHVKAVKWLLFEAQQGDAQSQYFLGQMYANGDLVPKNDAEAVKWFRLAAEQGHDGAQNGLGVS